MIIYIFIYNYIFVYIYNYTYIFFYILFIWIIFNIHTSSFAVYLSNLWYVFLLTEDTREEAEKKRRETKHRDAH